MADANSTVLVVDDDPTLRESVGRLLRSLGLEAQLFGSIADFLKSDPPDGPSCLVLDVRLPGQSGLDLQRELAAANRELPIIFITGHGDIPMTVQAMKGGAIEFLTKPFRDQDLLDAIRLGLSRDRARRENENVLADLHGNRFFSVEQFTFENGAGFAATHLNTVVLMQIDDRLRRASGIEIILRGDENELE
jgi:FixJ family two-component response regulator